VLADLYFIYGALVEQRRFLGRFGEEYREYMKKVPLLIPKPGILSGKKEGIIN
jgi:protein-S-isoprenylcysteine O-methyltransferase Ste14